MIWDARFDLEPCAAAGYRVEPRGPGGGPQPTGVPARVLWATPAISAAEPVAVRARRGFYLPFAS